jgi:tetratricopeptide (TPR) repeat protein
MDKDDLLVYDKHNNNPAVDVPLQEPPKDAPQRAPMIEQMPGSEPLLHKTPTPEIQQEDSKEGLPSQGALPAGPADQLPPEAAAPMPWWKRLLIWLTGEEGPDGITSNEDAAPLTVDDARALVQEELAHLREDTVAMVHHELERAEEQMDHRVQEQVPDLVQVELTREQVDHYRAARRALQEVGDEMATANLQWLQAQQDLLNQEVLPALQDPDLPLRERLELMNLVGDRPARMVKRMARLEAAVAKRVAESDQALVKLDARGSLAELQEEVERQSGVVDALEAQARRSAWGLVLALLLVAIVSVAGILLPRRTGPDSRLLIEMALLQQATGQNKEAVRLLDEAVEAGIGDAETLGRVGELYRLLKAREQAIDVLGRAVKKEPADETYRLSLARSYGAAGQYKEAIAQYERLIELDPNNLLYHAEMGHRYKAVKDYDQALAQYQKMLEIEPNRWHAFYYQGNVYRELERYDEAIERYQQALEIYPDYYLSRVYCGLSYAGKNEQARAIEQYQAAIELDPERHEAYYHLGKAFLAQGHFDRALGPFQRAVETDPNGSDALLGLGKVYLNLGDCESATAQFLTVLARDADNPEAQEGLAACAQE